MKKTCVIGSPISHSRSPLIHNYWLSKHRIEGEYKKKEVTKDELANFFRSFMETGYVGCNVTIPHKEAVLPFIISDEKAKLLGAVNTIYLEDDKLIGTNTDGEGFLMSLKGDIQNITLKNKSVTILGAGGAARSIIMALLDDGVAEIQIINRSEDRSRLLKNAFGPKIKITPWTRKSEALENQDLLVNTTSLGMKNQPELDISLDKLPGHAAVADIVYVPLETELIMTAKLRGNKTSPGLGMLLNQAVPGFKLWFDKEPEITAELRALLENNIRDEYL